MINRVLIRLKVLQILYSVYKGVKINAKGEDENLEVKNVIDAEKTLMFSLSKTYEMYFYLLRLICEITKYAGIYSKYNKTEIRIDKFINNKFANQLGLNRQMIEYFEKLDEPVDVLSEHQSLIKELWGLILDSEDFQHYIIDSESSYQKDKDIWKCIFKTIISESESLGKELEEKSIYWNDDAEIVVSFVIKTIKFFQEENGENQELVAMFKDDEDRKYACQLLKYTLNNESDYRELINNHAQNWDSDRIAFMDVLIMQVAIAEILNFPTIPVNVSINEYLEIAKSYSTTKSANFINGVLDSIVKKMREENKLLKVAQYTKNINN